jgi:hypothetical protein
MSVWGDSLKKYGWKCPYPSCVYEAIMYGEASLRVAKELHLAAHENNEQKAREEFRKLVPPPKKDYDVLELTVADKAFLKTRRILVD